MFNNLTDRLEDVFKKLRGTGKLTEENIKEYRIIIIHVFTKLLELLSKLTNIELVERM